MDNLGPKRHTMPSSNLSMETSTTKRCQSMCHGNGKDHSIGAPSTRHQLTPLPQIVGKVITTSTSGHKYFFVGKNTSIPESPRPTIYKFINGSWLFLLDDGCQIFLEEMVGNHQTSIFKWVFGVPGDDILPQSSWWNRRFIIPDFEDMKNQFRPWKLSNKYVGDEFVALLVQTTNDHLM